MLGGWLRYSLTPLEFQFYTKRMQQSSLLQALPKCPRWRSTVDTNQFRSLCIARKWESIAAWCRKITHSSEENLVQSKDDYPRPLQHKREQDGPKSWGRDNHSTRPIQISRYYHSPIYPLKSLPCPLWPRQRISPVKPLTPRRRLLAAQAINNTASVPWKMNLWLWISSFLPPNQRRPANFPRSTHTLP